MTYLPFCFVLFFAVPSLGALPGGGDPDDDLGISQLPPYLQQIAANPAIPFYIIQAIIDNYQKSQGAAGRSDLPAVNEDEELIDYIRRCYNNGYYNSNYNYPYNSGYNTYPYNSGYITYPYPIYG